MIQEQVYSCFEVTTANCGNYIILTVLQVDLKYDKMCKEYYNLIRDL